MKATLAAACALLFACSGKSDKQPNATPSPAGDAPAAASDARPATPAPKEPAGFDKSKLSPDVEACVGRDGKFVKCITRVRTGNRPKSLRFSPDGKELWVALHYDKPSVAVYDTGTYALIGAAETGQFGAVELAFNADGSKAYASQFETAYVYEIDRATKKVTRVLKTGSLESKVVALSHDQKHLYVANWKGNDVSEFDLASGKLRRSLKTPGIPRGLYITRDDATLWVAGFTPGRLYKFDLASGKRETVTEDGAALRHIVGDEKAGALYISDLGDARVYKVDLATDQMTLLAEVQKKPNTIALSRDGRVLYVSGRGANNPESYLNVGPEWGTVFAVDTKTGAILDVIVAGNQTTGLDVSPDGKWLATTDFMDNRINIYALPDTQTLIDGKGAHVPEYETHIAKNGDWGKKAPKDPAFWDRLP